MRCLLATTVQVSSSWQARVIRNDAASLEMQSAGRASALPDRPPDLRGLLADSQASE
jgi:hypothetical protein